MSAQHRRALVTGASSGIGEATAHRLARAGYQVALLARRSTELERVARAIERDAGPLPLVLECDLTDPNAIDRSVAILGRVFEGLDLLVNNAGVGYRARVEELEASELERVFDTNVIGLLWMCRAALPWLRMGDRPVVVNVASVVGRRGIPGQAAYAASKAAVCSIGESLRVEWATEGIRVATLNPALTATGFFDAQANPSGLPHPDTAKAAASVDVAEHVLALDQDPEPERSLRWKWRMLSILSILAPRASDRVLARRLGGNWTAP